jgi:hypothetical protein
VRTAVVRFKKKTILITGWQGFGAICDTHPTLGFSLFDRGNKSIYPPALNEWFTK